MYAAGTLLWAIEERLVAQPFDPAGGRLTGEAVTLVPAVYQGAGRTPAFWASESALVYAVGGSRERQFRWFDRDGHGTPDGGTSWAVRRLRFVPRRVATWPSKS